MHTTMPGRALKCAALLTVLLCSGCASGPRPLYYWGDYQPEVYRHFKTTGDSPEAQIARLDETQQRALSANAALPPGFNAHLGLLYLQAGQAEKARSAFLTEEAQFPESKPFLDFLMSKKSPGNLRPAAAPTTSAAPVTAGKPAAPSTVAPSPSPKPQTSPASTPGAKP